MVETFATGGVNSRDQLYRHSKGLLDSALCEHACVDAHEVPLCDTPVHRSYYCSATDAVRTSVGWTLDDETLMFLQGNACVASGLWHLPRVHWQDLRSSVMNVNSADFLDSLCHFFGQDILAQTGGLSHTMQQHCSCSGTT
eukprot:3293098-Amphidinium_carterae.4